MKIKEIFTNLGTGILVLIITGSIVVTCGIGGLAYKHYIGRADANVERDIFENSKGYVEGMVADLAKHERELKDTDNRVERKAIIEYINDKFANFDDDKIDNSYLREFLNDIRSGELQ